MPRADYQLGLSEEALSALHILAANIKEARKSRGWTIEEAARRSLLSINAYRNAEAGNPGTAMGVYLAALDTVGLADGLADVGAPHRDETGRRLKHVSSKLRKN
ncbi:helix-turn-helix domain-containing protein [Marinimicrobium locisalis]|uniref:helix-turn-helix domain-containing protein n=1 Tax=Marinimicrobium locisalis TaxID=546022 RepID=UPI003222134C